MEIPSSSACDGDYKPYTYVASDGTPNGADVELAREAFGRMGYDVQFEAIVWENKDEYLSSGEIDCLWSCYTMSGREDQVYMGWTVYVQPSGRRRPRGQRHYHPV